MEKTWISLCLLRECLLGESGVHRAERQGFEPWGGKHSSGKTSGQEVVSGLHVDGAITSEGGEALLGYFGCADKGVWVCKLNGDLHLAFPEFLDTTDYLRF